MYPQFIHVWRVAFYSYWVDETTIFKLDAMGSPIKQLVPPLYGM